jgi:hypothetical protein
MKAQYIEIDEYENKTYYSDKEMSILHREDGPAVERNNGNKGWYLNGRLYSEEEFNKKMNRAKTININGKEFTVEELNSLIASVEK